MLKKRKFTAEQKLDLFERYRSGETECYTELLESFVPLVEIIATKVKAKLPGPIEIGDLISDGFFGLADAIEKFDASKGYKFETYASARIRGAILDSLRDYDWVSRYSRIKFKDLLSAQMSLTEKLQREPENSEIAEFLGWSENEVYKIQAAYINSFAWNIDNANDSSAGFSDGESGGVGLSLSDTLADSTLGDYDFDFTSEDIASRLTDAMSELTEQESVVVYLHHYENLPFVKISEELGIGAARVSRIYSGALETLKSRLLES